MPNVLVNARQTQCCDPVIDGVIGALIRRVEKLETALFRNRQGCFHLLEMRKLSNGQTCGNLTREEIEAVIAEIDEVLNDA